MYVVMGIFKVVPFSLHFNEELRLLYRIFITYRCQDKLFNDFSVGELFRYT